MSFQRKDGRVLIDLSEEDFACLMLLLGYAGGHEMLSMSLRIANAINDGNPDWRPYEVPEAYADPS